MRNFLEKTKIESKQLELKLNVENFELKIDRAREIKTREIRLDLKEFRKSQ